jgi:hypothetical protein
MDRLKYGLDEIVLQVQTKKLDLGSWLYRLMKGE